MKRFFLFLLLTLSGINSLRADENVQAVQSRLKQSGFYFGDATGVYDSETAAAITRYQIRNGLPINGKLDAATAKSLGVPGTKAGATEPAEASGTWRRLRNGDLQFAGQLNSPPNGYPPRETSSRLPRTAKTAQSRDEAATPAITPTAGETGREKGAAAASARPRSQGRADALYGRERLRDYVGAFVLAGLDPRVGAELEFFSNQVDYFGKRGVTREAIRQDLVRYDQQWPERRFWLRGNLEVRSLPGQGLEVTFPLRYELRGHAKRASGEVMKTLILRKTSDSDLEIVAVDERKAHRP